MRRTGRKTGMALVFACLMAVASPALAREEAASAEAEALAALEAELPGTLMNDPFATEWKTQGTEATSKVVRVREIPGEYAYEVRVKQAGRNPWDVAVTAPLEAGVKKGDAVLVAFWASAETPSEETGAGTAQMRVQQLAAPYAGIAEATVTLNPRWQLHYVKGIAQDDFDASQIGVSFNIASQKQTLRFGQFYVMNLGPGVSLDALPSGAEEL